MATGADSESGLHLLAELGMSARNPGWVRRARELPGKGDAAGACAARNQARNKLPVRHVPSRAPRRRRPPLRTPRGGAPRLRIQGHDASHRAVPGAQVSKSSTPPGSTRLCVEGCRTVSVTSIEHFYPVESEPPLRLEERAHGQDLPQRQSDQYCCFCYRPPQYASSSRL